MLQQICFSNMNEVYKIANSALENWLVNSSVIYNLNLFMFHMIKHKYYAIATMHSSCATLEYIFDFYSLSCQLVPVATLNTVKFCVDFMQSENNM